jgi:hypothetical protein
MCGLIFLVQNTKVSALLQLTSLASVYAQEIITPQGTDLFHPRPEEPDLESVLTKAPQREVIEAPHVRVGHGEVTLLEDD